MHTQAGAGGGGPTLQQQGAVAEPRKGCRDPVRVWIVFLGLVGSERRHPPSPQHKMTTTPSESLIHTHTYVYTRHKQFFLVAFLVHLVGIIYLAADYGATAVRYGGFLGSMVVYVCFVFRGCISTRVCAHPDMHTYVHTSPTPPTHQSKQK